MPRLTQLAVLMAFAMILTTGITAQNFSNLRQQGDYILGFNGGVAYQQSDVATDLSGLGFGLTYGKNLIYAPHAPFSLDVRSRFQIARSFGTDIRPTLGIDKNDALNGEKTLDYTGDAADGLVYANHKTNQVEIGMEAVLTLNGLREKTGLGLSFTGGVGLDWYKTMIDQRNADGLYADQYQQVDAGGAKPFNLSQLEAIRDGKYETLADGFSGVGKFGIMPSLGLELDYDLTNNLALGVGHRMTFSGTDLLDGQRWTDNNILTGNNDILHYTSLGLKYRFNQQGTSKSNRKPVIELIAPYASGLNTAQAIVPIKATINRVNNAFDVYLTVNGREQKFNYNNGTLAGQLSLQPGENRIVISANNSAGSAKKTFFITYETNLPTSSEVIDFGTPEIIFTNPAYDNEETEEQRIKVRAKVRLADSQKAIELLVNGQKKRFDFDEGIEVLESIVDLKAGQNTIEIKAKNRSGEQRLTRTIFRALPVAFPTVNIISPAYNNATVDNPFASIKVNLTDIGQSTDIQLIVNGQNEPNFYFDIQTGQVKVEVQLREGRNEIEVIAINKRGEARDQRTIIYQRPYAPVVRAPRVNITAPRYSQSSTRDEVVTIQARLENIFRKSDIRLTNNGLAIYDFDFNPNNGILRHNLYLRAGINQVVIEAQNEAGQDGASATINFEVPLPPPPPAPVIIAPHVAIFQPRKNDVFEEREITIKANLSGVIDKRDIEFRVNREDCLDFRFNPANGSFRAKVNLREGENKIVIKIVNPAGKDHKQLTVFHERPSAPIVDFKRPNVSTTTDRNIEVRVKIDKVDNQRDIQLLLNNRRQDFRFRNGELKTDLRLAKGINEIEVIANNKYGETRERWSVEYFIPQPPNIVLSNMEDNQTFKTDKIELEAVISDIKGKRNIKLFVNGVGARTYDWEADRFTAPIRLKEGKNAILLKASNDYGKEEVEFQINYLRPRVLATNVKDVIRNTGISKPKSDRNKPTVKFVTTGKNRTQMMQEEISAVVKYIDQKDQLVLQVNGKVVNDFDFTDGKVTALIPLKIGSNVILLKAINENGAAESKTTLTRITGRPVISKGSKGTVSKKEVAIKKSRF